MLYEAPRGVKDFFFARAIERRWSVIGATQAGKAAPGSAEVERCHDL